MSDCKHSDRPMYMNISVTTLHSHIFNSIKGLVLRVVVGGTGRKGIRENKGRLRVMLRSVSLTLDGVISRFRGLETCHPAMQQAIPVDSLKGTYYTTRCECD